MRLPRRELPFALLLSALAILAYLLLWPVPIDPIVWRPATVPPISDRYAPNDRLSGIRSLPEAGPGPESVAIDRDGRLYTGLQDGRVMRMLPDGSGRETFVQTGGRPLGMKFDTAGNLVVGDAFRGLLSISPERKISVLADSVNGERMLFTNDLAIAADGSVWFSDASRRFDQHHWTLDFLEGRATGRLLHYEPRTGQVTVVLDRLMFANGVALGPGDQYVLVNETLAARITRYWLAGAKAGQSDVFAGALPGYPDNLTYNDRGVFWVALPSARNSALEALSGLPWLRKVVQRLPARWREQRLERMAWVLGFNTEGQVVHSLQDSRGRYGPVTSVTERSGRLYFGSIDTAAIGWAPAPRN
uniref:Gluconolactonase n=1 Tax=Solibacter usitatus (strain Ellin6076) TaxID=234267 RepID=Q01Y82_SOLUE